MSEVRRLAPLFLEIIDWLREKLPIAGILPAATTSIYHYCAALLANRRPSSPVTLVEGRAREVLTAADVALVASGTATLETLLLKRPMVVAYRVAPLTAWLAARFIRVSRIALPNLLAGKDVVPEFVQQAATVNNIGPALLTLLTTLPSDDLWLAEFEALHQRLRCNANAQAAQAIAKLLVSPSCAKRATGPG
jgi:lipid-A-disaccharide synthase